MDKILGLIGIAKKGGMLEIGEEPTGTAARAYRARVIFTASDAAENTIRRAINFSNICNAPHIRLCADKLTLGNTLGRNSCAMFAVCDAGIAAAIIKKLVPQNPECERFLPDLEARASRIYAKQKERAAKKKQNKTARDR